MEEINKNQISGSGIFLSAEIFFANLKKGSVKIKNSIFFGIAYSIIYEICIFLINIVENISGEKIYFLPSNSPFSNVSFKNRLSITNVLQKGIIKKIIKIPRFFYDEPYITQYRAESPEDLNFCSDGRKLLTAVCGGCDLNEEKAIMKAVGEAVERISLRAYREKNLFVSSYNQICKKALNPVSFVGISPSQRTEKKELEINSSSVFKWVGGFSLNNNKKIFIPAQLIYIGYKYHAKEPIIRQQISTGAAAAESLDEALYRGICEAVERDAFMITYLNRLSPPVINLKSIEDDEIQNLIRTFDRYDLKVYIVDITTDIKIPSFLAIIIDKTGVGPAIHISAKTGFNVREILKGVLFEGIRGRIGFRNISSPANIPQKITDNLIKNPSQIKTFTDRSIFWAHPKMIDKIDFIFCGKEKKVDLKEYDKYNIMNSAEKLKIAMGCLEKEKIDIFGIDITMPQTKRKGIYVAKIISPQLQPLYLNEGLRHTHGDRLFNIPVKLGYKTKTSTEKELNTLPHPFL